MPEHPPRGVPPGLPAAIVEILRKGPTPVRRRVLLAELERTGHRISLAGLNRALEALRGSGLTSEGPDGVALVRP